jgi:hypothetical protein
VEITKDEGSNTEERKRNQALYYVSRAVFTREGQDQHI